MPSVLPCSSTPSHRDRFHLPALRSACACGTLRACASSSASVCSAAERMFDCGAFTTITPRRVGLGDVDVVETDPGPADDDEVGAGREHLGGRPASRCGSRARRRPGTAASSCSAFDKPDLHVDLEAGRTHGSRPRAAIGSATRTRGCGSDIGALFLTNR